MSTPAQALERRDNVVFLHRETWNYFDEKAPRDRGLVCCQRDIQGWPLDGDLRADSGQLVWRGRHGGSVSDQLSQAARPTINLSSRSIGPGIAR